MACDVTRSKDQDVKVGGALADLTGKGAFPVRSSVAIGDGCSTGPSSRSGIGVSMDLERGLK